MRYLIIFLINILAFSLTLMSQNTIDDVVSEIAKNNTSLIALQKSIDTEKLSNKTGISLPNPEVGFNHLWGDPSDIGTRNDFSISQSFDFPTAYGYKRKIANLKNGQADLQYMVQQKNIILETKNNCIELLYFNALQTKMEKRLQHAEMLTKAYQAMFDIGETNILELNKTKLNHTSMKNDLSGVRLEIGSILSELIRLNGGKNISFSANVFPQINIPENFDEWYELHRENIPILRFVNQEVEISSKQEKLIRALNLPQFSAGYMSEKVVSEQFQGITLGISIPIWENKNTVKTAKAKIQANSAKAEDVKIQLYNQIKALHSRAVSLQRTSIDYHQALLSLNNTSLLQKALDNGELSLIEYLLEIQFYYETVNKSLEIDKQLHQTVAKLEKWI